MLEQLFFPSAGKVLELLSSPILHELSLAWGVTDELYKLHKSVSYLQALLLDADEQQEDSHQLKVWLGDLKDALCDAEEVLDDFKIDALRRKVLRRSRLRKVCAFYSHLNRIVFRFKMGRKLKNVRESLDDIAKNRSQFNLTKLVGEDSGRLSLFTTCNVDPSEVLGRDDDRENIVKLLEMPNTDGDHVSVVPIVGLGGLGKSTLAKLVYTDGRVEDQFDLRIWVPNVKGFELDKVSKKILLSANDAEDLRNLEAELRPKLLLQLLEGRKYLLVLDNVQNIQLNKWTKFKKLLNSGATGSKILVTTQSELVATTVAPTRPKYVLQPLPYGDCLSLFFRRAFVSNEADEHPNLVRIGHEIVEKYRGVPLAAITLGSLLRMEKNERIWINVRDNDIWRFKLVEGDILSALKSSYDGLSPLLKQCFAYCSIFPRDYQLNSFELTNLWSAQGFLQHSNHGKYLDVNIGIQFIEMLRHKGFFQDFEDLGGVSVFKMHSLVHDLAQLIAKPECIIINSQDVERGDSVAVQHVSFQDDGYLKGDDDILSWLQQSKRLHTIYFPVEGVGLKSRSFLETCISRFKRLYVLDLSDSSIETLPSSISRLKHLRYLDLRRNTNIKSLPDSICKLVGLETLLLEGCNELKTLPKDFGSLICLKVLSITTKAKCLQEKEIGCLTSLQHLTITGCPNIQYSLSNEGIERLSALQTLHISHCKSLVSLPTSGLRNQTILNKLVIVDCEMLNLTTTGEGCRRSLQLAENCPQETREDWQQIIGVTRFYLNGDMVHRVNQRLGEMA